MRKISFSTWALVGLVVVFATTQVLWLRYDQRPQRWDESIHMNAVLHFADVLRYSPSTLPEAFICDENYYPPLVPVLGTPFAFVSRTADVMTYSMIFFMALLAASVFGVTRRRFGSEAAVAASAMSLCYPLLTRESHYFMLDVPLAALVAAAFYALERSDNFRERGASLCFGILCGLGMLVKWMFPAFLAIPVMMAFVGVAKETKLAPVRRRNLWIVLGIGVCVAGPWYLWNTPGLVVGFWANAIKQGTVEGLPSVLSRQGILYYPQVLWGALTPFGFFSLLAGAWYALREPKNRALVWTVLAPVVLFAALPNRKDRYIMPMLPFAAILSTAWIPRLMSRWRGVVSTILTVGALVVLGISIWPNGHPDELRPDPSNWKIKELLSKIPSGSEKNLVVVPDHPYLNGPNCNFYAHASFPWIRMRSIFNFPMFADYVLVRTGDQGAEFCDAAKRRNITKELLDSHSPTGTLFEHMSEEPLPDGSTAYLLRRRTDLKMPDAALRNAVLRMMDKYVRDTKGFKFSVASEPDGSKDLKASFAEGFVGDYAHKPDALRMRNMELTVRGLWINPESLSKGEVQVLSVKSMDLASAEVTQEDLESFARPFAKGISDLRVDFEGGKVMATGKAGRMPLRIEVKLYNRSREEANVYFKVEKVRVGFLTVPSCLANFLLKDHNPLLRKNTAPVAITFGEILIEDGVLRIRE